VQKYGQQSKQSQQRASKQCCCDITIVAQTVLSRPNNISGSFFPPSRLHHVPQRFALDEPERVHVALRRVGGATPGTL
jgi:hypothetical protein